jgi:uncharacterized protein YbbC (DUF1343 family)
MKNSKFKFVTIKLVVKNTVLFLFTLLFLHSCCSKSKITEKNITKEADIQKEELVTIKELAFKTGAENTDAYISFLQNKKVGIVTNPTGIIHVDSEEVHVTSDGVKEYISVKKKWSVVDFLVEKKINLKRIFAPEHGFRGDADAGETIKDGKDTKTGLPIISLYGNNKKPKPEQINDLDVILFDIQDVGARFYTYISTLHYVMEACAENNIKLLVLDRPNPNGHIIDGPVLEKEFTSFVGMHPIPVLHGMTIGEYAMMIGGENWLKNGISCDVDVIKCLGYHRKMPYSLPVKPSPNLPNNQSINLYASLCFFEGTNVSVGRGTETQFQVYGSPFLQNMPFSFMPVPNFGAKDPMHNGKICYGEDLTNIKQIDFLNLEWLIKAYNQTEDKKVFFNDFFTKLAGTKKLQQQIESGTSLAEIRKSWQVDLIKFKNTRQKYLLYK